MHRINQLILNNDSLSKFFLFYSIITHASMIQLAIVRMRLKSCDG